MLHLYEREHAAFTPKKLQAWVDFDRDNDVDTRGGMSGQRGMEPLDKMELALRDRQRIDSERMHACNYRTLQLHKWVLDRYRAIKNDTLNYESLTTLPTSRVHEGEALENKFKEFVGELKA